MPVVVTAARKSLPTQFNSPLDWTLIQAWDTNLGDMTFIDTTFGGLARGSGGFWNLDGTRLTLHSSSQDTTRTFAVPTPWDPDSVASQISAFSVTNESHLYANEDGTIMWSLGTGDEIKERALTDWAVTNSTELSDSNKADRGHSGSNDGGYYPNNEFTQLISDGGPSNRTQGSSITGAAGDLDTISNDEGVAFNLWTSNAGAIGGSKISKDGLKIYRGIGAGGIQTITLSTPFNVVGGTTVDDDIEAEITFRPKYVLVNPEDTTEVWCIGDNGGGLQMARMATNV